MGNNSSLATVMRTQLLRSPKDCNLAKSQKEDARIQHYPAHRKRLREKAKTKSESSNNK